MLVGAMRAARLLLVEFLGSDRFSHYRSELFPFLQGHAKGRGVEVRWVAFAVAPDNPSGRRHVIAMHDPDAAKLRDLLRGFAPTHVLCNEHLDESSRALIESSGDGLVLSTTEHGAIDWRRVQAFEAWLGASPSPTDPDAWLVDEAQPDYASEAGNDGAMSVRPFVHVVAGPGCVYQRPLAKNPHYARLGERVHAMSSGCTFCDAVTSAKYKFATPPVELVLKQIRAAVRTCSPVRPAGSYLIHGIAPFFLLARLTDGLLAEQLPGCALLFSCRIDELLRMRPVIDRVLPRLAVAGHSIQIHNIGAENLSARENERMNKGISAEQFVEAQEYLSQRERQFPEAFGFGRYGGFGFITFTPWTTLDDLEENSRIAKQAGLGVDDLDMFAMSRIILLPGRPITELAEADGLLATQFDDAAVAAMIDGGCLNSWDQVEVPWRFADPRTEAIYAVLARTRRNLDDELSHSVRRQLDRMNRSMRRPGALLPLLLDAARRLPSARSLELLEAVAAVVDESERAQRPGRSPSRAEGPWYDLAARAGAVLEKLSRNSRNAFFGYRLESAVASADGTDQITVTMVRGKERIELDARGAQGFASAFIRTPHLSFSYRSRTPIDTTEKRLVARRVAAAIERFAVARA